MHEWDDEIDVETEESEEELIEKSNSATTEAHLSDFPAKGNNLNHIEPGLRIFIDQGKTGIEYIIDNGKGRIDILAIDDSGRFVVIELKLKNGNRRAIGQLLYDMGWIDANMGGKIKPCRGIIIADEIKDELKFAVSHVPKVKIASYKMNFSIGYV